MAEPARATFQQNRSDEHASDAQKRSVRGNEQENADLLMAKLRNVHAETERHDELLGIYETLHENERRLREMIDALPAAIYTTDTEGRLTHYNPAAIKLSGRVPELGSDQWCVTWKLFRADGTPMPHSEYPMAMAVKAGRAARDAEIIAERPDGKRMWLHAYPTPLRDAQGRISGGINMLVDVTEQKRSEAALRASEERLRAIVNQGSIGVMQVDAAGSVTLVNRHWCEMLGYSEAELLQMNIADITDPRDLGPTLEAIRRLAEGGPDFVIEKRYRRRDGSILWASSSDSALRGPAKEYLGMVAFVVDISEQHRRQMIAEGQKEAFERAAGGAPINAVLEILARTAREQSVSTVMTAIFIVDDQGVRLRSSASAGMPESYARATDGFPIGAQFPSCGSAAHSGQAVIVPDVEQDPLWSPYVHLAREYGFRACWSFPIRSFGGKTLGTFAVYHPDVREPDTRDLDLVNLLADTAAVLIGRHKEAENRKRAEESLRESEERARSLADKLEAEVRVRTKELEERNAEIIEQTNHLRLLSNRLMQSQDDERRRIARELHDSAGQYLAALGMSIEAARRSTKEMPPKVAERLDEATEIVGRCSSEIRTLSHLLHPPLLEELGLASAIEWYVEGFASRSNMEVKLQIPPKLRRLDESIELALFRVLQECLTNIHRHSGSRTAIVKVEADEHQVKLEVIDQGKGIAQPLLDTKFTAPNRLGVGINGMRERLKGLDGRLEIHSTDLGTTARAVIPLRPGASVSL